MVLPNQLWPLVAYQLVVIWVRKHNKHRWRKGPSINTREKGCQHQNLLVSVFLLLSENVSQQLLNSIALMKKIEGDSKLSTCICIYISGKPLECGDWVRLRSSSTVIYTERQVGEYTGRSRYIRHHQCYNIFALWYTTDNRCNDQQRKDLKDCQKSVNCCLALCRRFLPCSRRRLRNWMERRSQWYN